MTWQHSERLQVANSDDLHVSPFRDDGKTYGTPTWIWSVIVDNELYARAYNGTASRWYRAALNQGAGRVTVAGMTKQVAFHPVDGAVNDRIDDAYRAKYAGNRYLVPMISERARAATVKIVPLD